MPYNQNQKKYSKPYAFTPKKPVRSFRDLDVYQKSLECSVLISKNIAPALVKNKYSFTERTVECAMSVPLYIAEGHSLRFADFTLGVGYLEKAMASSNKTVVYLEQAKGLYGSKIDVGLVDDVIGRYMDSRVKMFHLEKSWKRFRTEYNDDQTNKGKGDFKY